jgi:hypothetical protein
MVFNQINRFIYIIVFFFLFCLIYQIYVALRAELVSMSLYVMKFNRNVHVSLNNDGQQFHQ